MNLIENRGCYMLISGCPDLRTHGRGLRSSYTRAAGKQCDLEDYRVSIMRHANAFITCPRAVTHDRNVVTDQSLTYLPGCLVVARGVWHFQQSMRSALNRLQYACELYSVHSDCVASNRTVFDCDPSTPSKSVKLGWALDQKASSEVTPWVTESSSSNDAWILASCSITREPQAE